ncbi:Gti1/Pac2 family-domain-containing protein, partial [Syncephalis pseudoplumigaleata]
MHHCRVEACKQGILPFTTRRLLDCEKSCIRHGSIFVFDEVASGMHRWTDGRLWSPSRISGNFLVYREAELKVPWRPHRPRQLFSRNKGLYLLKPRGMIKRTMSVKINEHLCHLVAYQDAFQGTSALLRAPRDVPQLHGLQVSTQLYEHQNFRRPP